MQLKLEEIFRKQLAEGDEVVMIKNRAENFWCSLIQPDILDNSHHSTRSDGIYNPEEDQIRERWLEVYFFCSFFICSSFMAGRNYFPKLLVPHVLELQSSQNQQSMDIWRRQTSWKGWTIMSLLLMDFHVVNFF